MIIYKDIISGDELISDVYDLKETADGLLEADCAMIKIKKGVDVDIGANASAEGGDDEGADGDNDIETVNNVIYSFRLQSTQFDKKSYKTYLGGYLKKLKAKLVETGKSEAEVAEFQKRAANAAKKIFANFDNYECYTGETMDPDGMICLLNYREDGITPFFTFWKDGLKEEKV